MPIPLYSGEGAFVQFIAPKRLARLIECGRIARVVKARSGHPKRAYLHLQFGERAMAITAYTGTKYSFEQALDSGHHAWKLRPLHRGQSETNLAPESVRPIFMSVLLDCLVEG